MRTYLGPFAEAQQFRENLISNLVYQTCIDELLKQDKAVLDQRQALEEFPDIEELADAVSEIEIDLESKWRKASMLYEGIC